MPRDLLLLTGTPGQAKVDIARKICTLLKRHGIRAPFASVEDELPSVVQDDSTDPKSPSNARLANLIGQEPQAKIRSLWPRALQKAATKADSRADISIVCCSLSYYRSETYEFYSPFDIKSLKQLRPRGILTLIDDTYDVYHRLSQEGEVFHFQELLALSDPPVRRGTRALYRHAINLSIQNLLRVLVWREKEIDAAAVLGRALSVPAHVIAVKHPIESAVRLLLCEASVPIKGLTGGFPVYISHPISRPRSYMAAKGTWPGYVRNLNTMVESLRTSTRGRSLIPIMPTAIDEYRLLKLDDRIQPRLTPRWPLPDCELLYCRPSLPGGGEYMSHDDFEARALSTIFDPPVNEDGRRLGMPLSDSDVSGMLSTLNQAVRLQKAGRDHLLVRQCPGFFLFRPVFDGEFTSGVLSELHTYDQIRKWENQQKGSSQRRIAFLHDEQDVVAYFEKPQGPIGNAKSGVYQAAAELAQRRGKTRYPNQPGEATARALREPSEVSGHAEAVYDELFPKLPGGSIGTEEPIPFEDVSPVLTGAIAHERSAALASFLDGKYEYVFSKNSVQQGPISDSPGLKPDTYIEVVAGIDVDKRMDAAGQRVREFFTREVPLASRVVRARGVSRGKPTRPSRRNALGRPRN